MKLFLFLLTIVVLSSSISSQSMPPAADLVAIRSIEEVFRTAWLRNDEGTIMSLFMRDATLYPGGNAPIRGIDALEKYWFGPSDVVTAIDRFDVEIEDIAGTGKFATATGADVIYWSTAKKGGTDRKHFVSKGHFIAVYVKTNNQWRIQKRFAASKTEEISQGVKK